MMFGSLRRRLLFAILAVFSLAWIATALGAWLDSRNETEELLDAELQQVAKVLLTMSRHELEEELLARGRDLNHPLEMRDLTQLPGKYDAKLAFQVWIHDNQLALRSSNSPSTRFAAVANGFSASGKEGDAWRVYSLTDEETQITVQVGEHYSVRDELVNGAAWRTILPLLIAAPVIALLTWFGVGRALRPLQKLAEHVAGRNPYDLSPIDAAHAPKETRPLVESLNRLFGNLQNAFENTRRFTADAAHELRTPLAGMAAQADVALLANNDEVRSTALVNMKTAIKNMTRLVQQLLTLTRWDSETVAMTFAPIDFTAIVSAIMRQFETAAAAHDIQLKFEFRSAVTLDGDETGLQLIARNIIDNAVRYTPHGGAVTVEVGEREDVVWLSVTDTGPGIEPAQRELIFQRFYRGDQQHISGSGLGLSIVQRCVSLHGGEIKLMTPEHRGLQVMVRLPKYQYAQGSHAVPRIPAP